MAGRLYLSPDSLNEIIIICHGFGSSQNSSTVGLIKDWALEHSKSVITFDFSGHGESEGDFRDLTITGSIADTDAIMDYAAKQLSFQKITLVGFSYGGLVASAAVNHRSDITNLVLVNPLIDYHEKEILFHHEVLLEKWAKDGIRKYVIHDKVLHLDYAYYRDSLRYSAYDLLKNTKVNVLFFHARNDEMIPFQQAVRLAKMTGLALHAAEGADHRLTTIYARKNLISYLDHFLI